MYNYFSNSPKRIDQYKEFQEFANVSPHKILHPSQTRWLSLESVVKRLISQYAALILFFTDQSYEGIMQAGIILEKLQNPSVKLYLDFLAYMLPYFNNLNKLMQNEKPQVHKIYIEITSTLKTILQCYIKPDVLRKDIYEIDFANPRNFLNIDEMYFGASLTNSQIDKNILKSVKVRCLDFYIESVKQITSRFPLKNSLIEKMQFFDPEVIKTKKKTFISDVAMSFPNFTSAENYQDLDNEWRMLLNFPLDNVVHDDIEMFWKKIALVKIGDDSLKFPTLVKFVFNVLCLPHSSAAVERIFSQINLTETQFRNRLKVDTIEGILHTKRLMGKNTCYDFDISISMIKKLGTKDVYLNKKDDSSNSDSD